MSSKNLLRLPNPRINWFPQQLRQLRMRLVPALRMEDLLPRFLDVVLQMHQRIEHGFRSRRASRDIHIDRDDLINSGYRRVIIVEPP